MAIFFCSDLHGEYDLFMRLTEKCRVGSGDVVYVLGDVIAEDKTFKALCGNHEYALLQVYHDYMEDFSGEGEEEVLRKIRNFYPTDGEFLTWNTIDHADALPFYIEEKDFICVHAGLEMDADGRIVPMEKQNVNRLIYDRKFKERRVIPQTRKTVLFGHTPCYLENGTGKFIKTLRPGVREGRKLSDYIKIRLDTGVAFSGMLGMLRSDENGLTEIYVEK